MNESSIEIQKLKDEKESLESQISDIEDEISDLQNEINDLENEIETIDRKILKLKGRSTINKKSFPLKNLNDAVNICINFLDHEINHGAGKNIIFTENSVIMVDGYKAIEVLITIPKDMQNKVYNTRSFLNGQRIDATDLKTVLEVKKSIENFFSSSSSFDSKTHSKKEFTTLNFPVLPTSNGNIILKIPHNTILNLELWINQEYWNKTLESLVTKGDVVLKTPPLQNLPLVIETNKIKILIMQIRHKEEKE